MGQALIYDFPNERVRPADCFVAVREALEERREKEQPAPALNRAILSLGDLEKCLHEQKDGLLITNGDGVGLWVNKAMEKVVGLTPDFFLQKPINHLFENGIFQYQAVTERARCQKNELTDLQVVNTGNTVLVTSVPIVSKKQIKYMITTVRNMAQLKQTHALKGEQLPGKSDPAPVLQSLGMVYNSQAMQRVIEIVGQVACADAPVLISGETGVGKEIVARLIHELSPRRSGPFLKLNCAALPKELAESELFGYEPGAFTGARTAGKAGFFEVADGGTLLLDEVGEMPLEIQAKILRVLQDQEVLRLGSTRSRPVNVRVLAATNSDLPVLVQQKLFRADLYYRLNVVPIEIPPLRCRPADIPLLLGHYLRLFCQKYSIYRKFHPAAFQLLLEYSWPGNVRELINLVHRLVLISNQPEITPGLLPEYIRTGGQFQDRVASLFSALHEPPHVISRGKCHSLREILEYVEREVIETALKSSRGIRDASRMLGIPHPTLLVKMKKYGLEKHYGRKS